MKFNIYSIGIIVIIIVAVIILLFSDMKLEFYKITPNMEKCEYDPVVQKIKNKVYEFIDSRELPWVGELKDLNDRKKNVLKKLMLCKGKSSYTIDKSVVYLCVKDENGEYYNDNMLIHVLLHEFAHAICDEIGHTVLFDKIFTSLLDEADSPTDPKQKPIYDKKIPLVNNYCGVKKTDTYDTSNP